MIQPVIVECPQCGQDSGTNVQFDNVDMNCYQAITINVECQNCKTVSRHAIELRINVSELKD